MPMPSHYTVGDGLTAGAYPDLLEDIESLEAAAVTVFVDLTHPSDPLPSYVPHLRAGRRIAHPIPDMSTPSAGLVMQVLDDIDGARDGGEHVYVHCWGGVGRTGTVVGCWLVRHRLDDGDPIAAIAALRRELDERASPETPGQVQRVRGWRPGW